MKIDEIHIYGYGKLENLIIRGLSKRRVFYGLNEAGKTTIMSFIHSMLFGFPTKQQSELRYEPKNHSKYGGKIIIIHPEFGQVLIERVKGKSSGDVTVKLDNGEVGGEELLAKVLSNIDKTVYQAIYSFNLAGLQNVQQMKGEDLGKFLFSTGVVGTDKLLRIENELKKELDSRFKPSGSKPIINLKLKELEELQLKLVDAQKKNNNYSSLIEKKAETEDTLNTIQNSLKNIQLECIKLEEWIKNFPYVKELLSLEREIEIAEPIPFPIDGLNRYETLMKMIQPLEAQLKGLDEKVGKLIVENEELLVNQEILKLEAEVDTIVSLLPLYEKLDSEIALLTQELEGLKLQMNVYCQRINSPISAELLANIDTSIFMKENIRKLHTNYFLLKEQKNTLDNQFNEEKNSLERIEHDITFMKEQLLSDEERRTIVEMLEESKNNEKIENELKLIHKQLHDDEGIIQVKHSEKKKDRKLISLIIIFVFFLVLWSGLNKHWDMLTISTSMGIFFILFYIINDKKKGYKINELSIKLKQEQKKLLVKLEDSSKLDSVLYENRLSHDDKLIENLQLLKLNLQQQQIRYDQAIKNYEKWEQEFKFHENAMGEIMEKLNLPLKIPYENLNDAFEILTKMKEYQISLEAIQNRLNLSIEKKIDIENNLFQLAKKFNINKKMTIMELGIVIKEALKEESRKDLQLQTNKAKLEDIKLNCQSLEKEIQYLNSQISHLFHDAQVENEEDFRTKAKSVKLLESQSDRIKVLKIQLNISDISSLEMNKYSEVNKLKARVTELMVEYSKLEEEYKQEQSNLAELKHQIALLEEGGTYSKILHQYQQQKFEFNELAKEWGSYAIAKQLLTKTIDKYKNEKLPRIITQAEEYLELLTLGSYSRIHPKVDDSGFIIERSDHTLFEASELSQATMEQVYVSLRLALATKLYEKQRFPILIDDSFVNFDLQRTTKIMSLLNTISDRQILFFTCHKHFLTYFGENQIIFLGQDDMVGNELT